MLKTDKCLKWDSLYRLASSLCSQNVSLNYPIRFQKQRLQRLWIMLVLSLLCIRRAFQKESRKKSYMAKIICLSRGDMHVVCILERLCVFDSFPIQSSPYGNRCRHSIELCSSCFHQLRKTQLSTVINWIVMQTAL